MIIFFTLHHKSLPFKWGAPLLPARQKKKGSGLGSGSNLASGCGVVCLGTTILIEVNHT